MARRDETNTREAAGRRPALTTRFITGDDCYAQSRGDESGACERMNRELREGLGTSYPDNTDGPSDE